MALYLDGQKIISGGSGSGGHTIVDSEGTSLEQRTNLQFNGAYSEDNAADDTTEIDVVREMTKAEFDELTEAEKTGLINITDITGGNDDRFQPVIYSEDEREIGVWIDGKPLYEKVFTMNQITVSSSWVNTTIDTTDIDTIASAFGIAPDGTFYSGLDGDPTTSSHTVLSLRSYATSYIVKLILQYTKISDTAGSGQWTPQGVPAHHYSTDEQVVGTWIDGSAVYEKTFELSDRTSVKNDYSTIIISDTTTYAINNIIDCVYYDNNGGSDLSVIRALPTNIETYLSANNTLIAYYNTDNVYQITKFTLRYTKTST